MGRHSAPAPTPEPHDAARPPALQPPALQPPALQPPALQPPAPQPPAARDGAADDAGTHADDADDDAVGTGLVGRAVLPLTAAVSTILATSWAGLPWRYAALAGIAAAAVVVVSAWIAGTMPGRPTPYSDARDSDHPRE